jgi:hypothetical protein
MVFPIGNQRVGIVTATAAITKTELFETDQAGETVVWVDRASFQIQIPTEDQNIQTTTVMEYAKAHMPVVDGNVPAVDGAGAPAPIAVGDISSIKSLRYPYPDGPDYLMRGDAVLRHRQRGQENHVYARCERQVG